MIRLAPNGIFPIVYNEAGEIIADRPKTGFDLPGTIQGEGKLSGVPSLFIRLWGCNLNCSWKSSGDLVSYCDTQEAITHKDRSVLASIDSILNTVKNNRGKCDHVVVTGGEPLLQKKELSVLLKALNQEGFHVTLESNGLIFSEEVLQYVDLLSLSPKLIGSYGDDLASYQMNQLKLQESVADAVSFMSKHSKDFQLKFVVSTDDEVDEIKRLVSGLENVCNNDILLMPLGGTLQDQQKTIGKTIELAIRTGWRFAPRLHIMQWNDERGV